jgi:hypothetical protein
MPSQQEQQARFKELLERIGPGIRLEVDDVVLKVVFGEDPARDSSPPSNGRANLQSAITAAAFTAPATRMPCSLEPTSSRISGDALDSKGTAWRSREAR